MSDRATILSTVLRETFPIERDWNYRFVSGHCANFACALAEVIDGQLVVMLRAPTPDEDSDVEWILSHVIVEAHDTTFDCMGHDARDKWKSGFWNLGPDVEWDEAMVTGRADLQAFIADGGYDTTWRTAEIERIKRVLAGRLTSAGYFSLTPA